MYRLELYEQELKATKKGKEIMELIMLHVDEVSRLINQNREVMVTWQRNKGAVFFSQFMGSGFNRAITMKKEVEGICLSSLIRRMAVALQDHGSRALATTIDEYLLLVLEYAGNCDSLHEVFQKIRQYE